MASVSWGKSWSWAWWDRWYVLILLWLKGYILAQYFMLLAHYFMFSFIISCFYKVEKVRERLWLPVLLVSFVLLWEKTEFSRKTPRGLTWSSCLVFLNVYWVYKAPTVHGLSPLTIQSARLPRCSVLQAVKCGQCLYNLLDDYFINALNVFIYLFIYSFLCIYMLIFRIICNYFETC